MVKNKCRNSLWNKINTQEKKVTEVLVSYALRYRYAKIVHSRSFKMNSSIKDFAFLWVIQLKFISKIMQDLCLKILLQSLKNS